MRANDYGQVEEFVKILHSKLNLFEGKICFDDETLSFEK